MRSINEYLIDLAFETNAVMERTEVAATPEQALWQAFGVWVQDCGYVVNSVWMKRSTDKHYDDNIGGDLIVTLGARDCHGNITDETSTATFMVRSVSVDCAERVVVNLPPIVVTREAMDNKLLTVTETINNRDLSGWFVLSNGHKVGWIASNGDGELSAFVEKPDGGFINELSGWYRTSNPDTLLQKVVTIAGWEMAS